MSRAERLPRERALWAVLLGAIACVYLYQAPYFTYLNNPNENVRVYMTRSIVEHGTFAIDDVIAEWGYVNDKATFDGRMYPGKAPGTSYLGVPAYWVHYRINQALERKASKHEIVMVCRLGGAILPLLVFLFAFARFTERVAAGPAVRMVGVTALSLGSTVLTYGGIFASHSLVAACLFGAYMAAHRHAERPRAWLPSFGVGFLIASAFALEYPGALGGAVVGLYALNRSPDRARFVAWSAAGMALPLALLGLYHHAAFGGIFELPYSHLENPEFVEHVSGGFFGMERISSTALHGSYFAPFNGLFWFLPWTLVSFVGLVFAIHFRSLREPAVLTIAMIAVYTVFIAMVDNWRGGWTAGPRYIVPVVPFMAWYLILFLAEIRRTELGVPVLCLAFALVAASQFNCGVSAAVFPHYPEGIENPIFEVALHLLVRGYAPHSLGTLLGFDGPWTLLPVWVAHAVAWGLPIGIVLYVDSVERLAMAAVALALALAFVSMQSEPSTRDVSFLDRTVALTAELWEPADPVGTAMLRGGQVPPEVRYGRASSDELRAAARAAARRGLTESAASLYERARRVARTEGPYRTLRIP